MQNESLNVSLRGALEHPALEDVVILADSTGVAIGVPRALGPSVPDDAGGRIASGWIEIPLVGGDGEISGVMYQIVNTSETSSSLSPHRPERGRVTADAARFVVHDINNLFAMIASGLRLLERQDDAMYRMAIVGRMEEAITRGGLLSRQLLETVRLRDDSNDEVVDGNQLAAMIATRGQALRPHIAVRAEIAPDLWDFNADPDELYFALLKLCRNSANAMLNRGAITIAARNIEASGAAATGAVAIIVADHGECTPKEALSEALDSYFTAKRADNGSGGLRQVRHRSEARGGATATKSKEGGGTWARLILPRVNATEVSGSIAAGEIAYKATPDGGAFYLADAPTTPSTE